MRNSKLQIFSSNSINFAPKLFSKSSKCSLLNQSFLLPVFFSSSKSSSSSSCLPRRWWMMIQKAPSRKMVGLCTAGKRSSGSLAFVLEVHWVSFASARWHLRRRWLGQWCSWCLVCPQRVYLMGFQFLFLFFILFSVLFSFCYLDV